MKRYQKGLLLLALLPGVGLSSCSDDNPWSGSDQEGGIYLNLESDGRIMQRGTRADDTMCPIVPDPNAFGVHLTNADNTYSKTWSSLEGFNNEKGFPMGDYTIEASYGDLNQEGFELPYYKGVNTVHVAPSAETPVNVTATLGNAMVSIRYNQTFTDNFKQYSAAVQTDGHDWVVFAQDETRPAFIDPTGTKDVKLSVTMTNDQDQTVTVEPVKFKAQARHHYVITVNATGNVSKGDLVLNIEFTEDVVTEKVDISLGDDLFNAPAPEVRAKGFTVGTPVSKLAYDELSESPEFNIFAFGGFNEVTMTVINDEGSYHPTFGQSVQLVNAQELTQNQLASEGVVVSGLFKNQDKMAVVNVKKFLENLPAGKYTVQMQAKDAMTRLSEPVELKAEIGKTDYTMSTVASAPISYLSNEMTLDISTNSEQVKNPGRVVFKVDGRDVTVKSITPVTSASGAATRAAGAYTYRFVLDVPEIVKDKVAVESRYGKMKADGNFNVAGPEYTVQTDAFARFVVFKIDAADNMMANLTKNIEIYNGSAQVGPSNIKRDVENGLITVSGLNSTTEYANFKLRVAGAFEKGVAAFTTETETGIVNGNFSESGRKIQFNVNDSRLNVGGMWKVKFIVDRDYQTWSSIDRTEPAGWATLNDFTCYGGSSNHNTWFLTPSTFLDENNQVIVRSVGYHHNGTTPATSGGSANMNYYCENAPEELNAAAGELFLGSYTFNGSGNGTKVKGVDFATRPTGMQFKYKYTPWQGEVAQADIQILDGDGNVIATQTEELSSAASMTVKNIELKSYQFNKKAAKIYICFRSTKNGVTPKLDIPSGEDLKESGINSGNFTSASARTLAANTYHAYAKGSELTIDDVVVTYDGVPTITK